MVKKIIYIISNVIKKKLSLILIKIFSMLYYTMSGEGLTHERRPYGDLVAAYERRGRERERERAAVIEPVAQIDATAVIEQEEREQLEKRKQRRKEQRKQRIQDRLTAPHGARGRPPQNARQEKRQVKEKADQEAVEGALEEDAESPPQEEAERRRNGEPDWLDREDLTRHVFDRARRANEEKAEKAERSEREFWLSDGLDDNRGWLGKLRDKLTNAAGGSKRRRRKSTKRKSTKRKPTKRKSIKRKSIKRKSTKKKLSRRR